MIVVGPFTLILTLLALNGEEKTVDLHTQAPSLNACMNDQPSMAKFIGDNPNYRIIKWHCEDTSKKKMDI